MSDKREEWEKEYARGETPWDSGVPSSELRRALRAGQLPGATALELGCGTGTNAMELARNGYRVTAVDFVESAVNQAREKARSSSLEVDFVLGDVTAIDLGGPYDVVFDRGLYHTVRTINLPAFLKMLERVAHRGARWLSLMGNANEPMNEGPPVVREDEFCAELEPLFKILEVREFRFTTDRPNFRPLAWSVLMERR